MNTDEIFADLAAHLLVEVLPPEHDVLLVPGKHFAFLEKGWEKWVGESLKAMYW